jgi:hypothetical protein
MNTPLATSLGPDPDPPFQDNRSFGLRAAENLAAGTGDTNAPASPYVAASLQQWKAAERLKRGRLSPPAPHVRHRDVDPAAGGRWAAPSPKVNRTRAWSEPRASRKTGRPGWRSSVFLSRGARHAFPECFSLAFGEAEKVPQPQCDDRHYRYVYAQDASIQLEQNLPPEPLSPPLGMTLRRRAREA